MVTAVGFPGPVLCAMLVMASDGAEAEGIPAISGREDERDYPAKWVETKAYVNAPGEVREAMMSLARLAKEYDVKTEDEIMALPGRKEVKVSPLGDAAIIKIASPDGGTKEFQYSRPNKHLQYVIVVAPDGSRISLNYTTPRYKMRPMDGTVSTANSGRSWLFNFDVKDGHLKCVYPIVGNSPGSVAVMGRYILWDADGSIAFQKQYSTPKTLLEVSMDVRAALSEDKARELGFVPEEGHTDAFHLPDRPIIVNQGSQKPAKGER